MAEKFQYFCCSHIGVSGTTDVVLKKLDNGTFEARCGFALLGQTNMDEAGFKACDSNPFHPEFHDNYAVGKGKTEAEALTNLKKDMHDVADTLWM